MIAAVLVLHLEPLGGEVMFLADDNVMLVDKPKTH